MHLSIFVSIISPTDLQQHISFTLTAFVSRPCFIADALWSECREFFRMNSDSAVLRGNGLSKTHLKCSSCTKRELKEGRRSDQPQEAETSLARQHMPSAPLSCVCLKNKKSLQDVSNLWRETTARPCPCDTTTNKTHRYHGNSK